MAMAIIIQGPGQSWVRGPAADDSLDPAGGDPLLTQNQGEAGVFNDLPTAQAWMAAHNPLPGGVPPTYVTVNGDENFSLDTTT